MAPREPLVGAALIARFMAAVAQPHPLAGELESRRVRVNGQPGRLVRGPDVAGGRDAAVARDAAGAGKTGHQAKLRVWSVLTVEVVEGRIETVRIVRNPDKLGHL